MALCRGAQQGGRPRCSDEHGACGAHQRGVRRALVVTLGGHHNDHISQLPNPSRAAQRAAAGTTPDPLPPTSSAKLTLTPDLMAASRWARLPDSAAASSASWPCEAIPNPGASVGEKVQRAFDTTSL
jgi:hypothetical protein